MIAPRTRPDSAPWRHAATMLPARRPGLHVVVEIGPGNGDYLLQLGPAHPDWHCIGIELKRGRFDTIARRMATADLANISLIHGNAADVLPQLRTQHAIQAIYILFPDPWPKRRHGKHRLMQPAFVQCCAEALAPGGELWFTTDDAAYAHETVARITTHTALVNGFPTPFVTELPDAFPTYFARKWQAAGRTIHYLHYRKG